MKLKKFIDGYKYAYGVDACDVVWNQHTLSLSLQNEKNHKTNNEWNSFIRHTPTDSHLRQFTQLNRFGSRPFRIAAAFFLYIHSSFHKTKM